LHFLDPESRSKFKKGNVDREKTYEGKARWAAIDNTYYRMIKKKVSTDKECTIVMSLFPARNQR
jgi:hypothetical protein